MIAGEKDRLVPLAIQALSFDLARKRLHTDSSRAATTGFARSEPGVDGSELVAYVHPGGHELPRAALPLVVRFFQRHSLGASSASRLD